MTTTELFVLLAVGRLIIYLAQKSPYLTKIPFWKEFFLELRNCDLCMGVFVFGLLSVLVRKVLFCDIFGYVPAFSELITGMVLSFMAYLIRNGWDARYKIYHLEDD